MVIYSILPIRSVKAVMSLHRKWMRLLPLYSSAVLNICLCLPFHWKISQDWVNFRLEMNNNNIKIKNAALMPSYIIIFLHFIKKKNPHGFWLTLPSFATASTSTSLAPRMNLVMTTGCSWRTNSSRLFLIQSTDQGCNISSWCVHITLDFASPDQVKTTLCCIKISVPHVCYHIFSM